METSFPRHDLSIDNQSKTWKDKKNADCSVSRLGRETQEGLSTFSLALL